MKSSTSMSFKCKICSLDKPSEDSVSLESKICCTCFTSIQIHERVREKINFYKKILAEEGELTPIKIKKIRLVEKMNDFFSFSREDILILSEGDIEYFIEEYIKQNSIKALRYRKRKYLVKEYDKEYYDFGRMGKTLKAYQSRINDSNRKKIKFWRFIKIIGEESGFVVLKDRLKKSLFDFIDNEEVEEYEHLRKFIFEGISKIYEPGLMPNVALFFYNNYEHIFSTLMTQILPFDKERIAFDFPKVNSRTDFGLKLHYRYNSLEVNYIQDIIDINGVKWDRTHVSRFLFINSIKTITRILDDVFQYYYRKHKIRSPVQSIVNISGSAQKSTKRSDEVTFWVAMREW
ncbi:MAG: hypothetical protein GY870_16335 [archaeon]|nr:hypothetical protein [archaeon]